MISTRLAVLIFVSAFGCRAQGLVPSITLSADAATQARQTFDELKRAQMQNETATSAWRNFIQAYQSTHPDLPSVHFTSDFTAAVSISNPNSQFPQLTEARLTPEEQRQASTRHQAMDDSKRALDQAQRNWLDFEHQLGADAPSDHSGWSDYTLQNGKPVRVFTPWNSGLAFTSDFRLATPQTLSFF